MPAVIYAAKSTEDKHGSIPTQIADCRARAEREGWEVIDTFSDEAFSAYSGNRGPGLEQAKALAARIAAERGRCILVAQDADRFARGAGDAPGAADHLGEVFFAMRRQRVSMWTDRSGELDPIRAALEGERSTDESARKSQAVRAGHARRAAKGLPMGAVPVGYTVEKQIVNDEVISRRVVDPQGAALVERMWTLTEAGHSPGRISRTLNAEGARTKRGGHWTTRAVKRVLENPDYKGGTGYPSLIESDRWDAIQARLTRLDPAAVQARKGGRPAADDFLLAGLAFCRVCGAPMRLRRYRYGARLYRCRNTMEGIGMCNSRPVPAEIADRYIVEHLHLFVGDVEDWLAEKVAERSEELRRREALIDTERTALAALDRQREKHLAEYRRLVDTGSRVAYLALEEVERIDRERERQVRAIAEAEAVVSEWSGPPDMDAALDYYNEIVATITGALASASGIHELNTALKDVLAGMWLERDDDLLNVEFRLRPPKPYPPMLAQTLIERERPIRTFMPEGAKPDPSPWCMSSRGRG